MGDFMQLFGLKKDTEKDRKKETMHYFLPRHEHLYVIVDTIMECDLL